MDINTSRTCNRLSLELLSDYFNEPFETLEKYYQELLADDYFLNALNRQIRKCRTYYNKGLFSHSSVNSVDWFGNQRISLYVLIRYLKPLYCVETGVFYGGTTSFMLNALEKNKQGSLISIDLTANQLMKDADQRHMSVGDSELISKELQTGFLIPDYLKQRWRLIVGSSLKVIETLDMPFSFFSHDSEHSHGFMKKELTKAMDKMVAGGVMFVDDINWSNGFFDFCVTHRKYPLILPDNGKNGIQARLGVVKLDHENNNVSMITG